MTSWHKSEIHNIIKEIIERENRDLQSSPCKCGYTSKVKVHDMRHWIPLSY